MRKGVVAFLIVVAALVFVANYDRYTVAYECSGVMKTTPITLFVKITQYRWWAFYGGGRPTLDGVLWLEPPTTTGAFRYDIFGIKHNLAGYLDVYRWPDGGEVVDDFKKLDGQFSTMSNSLTLNISDEESFRGTCTPKNT